MSSAFNALDVKAKQITFTAYKDHHVMARTKAIATTGNSKALSTLDQELAKDIADLKERISQPGGNQIKINANGTFTAPDGFDLGSEIQVVVLDFVSVNKFYSAPYVKDQIVPPDCYAVGRKDLIPLPESPAVQNPDCHTCPLGGVNAFGSGVGGRGKACQNRRVLAVLLNDPNDPNSLNDPKAQICTLDLSPTNMKFFDGYVANVSRTLGHPIKAIGTVTATNIGTYAQVSFTDPVPNPYYAMHAERRTECQDILFRKPDFSATTPPPQKNSRAAPRRAAVVPARAANARR